ncbi:MAG: DegT/DnrJ/EryC1/StrS family aminotransferase, partial [Actinomycetota bacterium]
LSFHETKNVTCGEGGALLVNDAEAARRAEIVWDKGTNRAEFERGEVDRYTWIEVASSFGLGEVSAAFLWAQLERAREVTELRLEIWNSYHDAFAELEREGRLRRPLVPPDCEHNAHMYFLLLPEPDLRARFIQELAERDIHAVFHYVPLHSSPAGRRVGRVGSGLENTERLSERLVRLPLWAAMPDEAVHRVIEATRDSVNILAR